MTYNETMPARRDASALAALLENGAEQQRLGRPAEALAAFERCLDASPAHPDAHRLAGFSNFQLGRWAKGVAHMRVAVAAAPGNAASWSNLAFGLRSLGRLAEAREAARRAVALHERSCHAWNVLGLVEQDDGRIEEARAHFARALEIDPSSAESRMNLANCDQAQGRIDRALAGYREAAAMDATLADVPYNIGHLHHKATARFEEAIARYRDAIALRPAYAHAHHNLAHALFLTGRFGEAWREYRWRPTRLDYEALASAAGTPYEVPAAPALEGSRWLVGAEKGLGDVLFLLRFAAPLHARGGTLDFAGDPRLHGMLARTGLFRRLGTSADEIREAGVRPIMAGDLALLLPEAQSAIAIEPLPLTPEPERVAALRARLAQLGPPPYGALAWRSGMPKAGLEERLFKEVPLDAFGRALSGVRATWLSIQREPRAGETEALAAAIGAPVHDLSRLNEDLEEALALMALAERVVGVSNTNIHLRAGAGGFADVLVPFPPEWRWMAAGDSPWFPAMRVYRQDMSRDWRDAMDSLGTAGD